jgi:hypothetical protein
LREIFSFNIYFSHFGKILYQKKKTLSQIDDYQQKDLTKFGYRTDVKVFL